VHAPAPSSLSLAGALAASQSTLPSSRPGTPPRDAGTPASAGTPNGGMNKDGTVLLDCVGCGRPVRATRLFPPPARALAFGAVVDGLFCCAFFFVFGGGGGG